MRCAPARRRASAAGPRAGVYSDVLRRGLRRRDAASAPRNHDHACRARHPPRADQRPRGGSRSGAAGVPPRHCRPLLPARRRGSPAGAPGACRRRPGGQRRGASSGGRDARQDHRRRGPRMTGGQARAPCRHGPRAGLRGACPRARPAAAPRLWVQAFVPAPVRAGTRAGEARPEDAALARNAGRRRRSHPRGTAPRRPAATLSRPPAPDPRQGARR